MRLRAAGLRAGLASAAPANGENHPRTLPHKGNTLVHVGPVAGVAVHRPREVKAEEDAAMAAAGVAVGSVRSGAGAGAGGSARDSRWDAMSVALLTSCSLVVRLLCL
jgi:hypothetical protein